MIDAEGKGVRGETYDEVRVGRRGGWLFAVAVKPGVERRSCKDCLDSTLPRSAS